MKRFAIGLLWGVAAYVIAAAASYFLVLAFSSNSHDREVEAAMTSALLFGPVGALLAFIAGIVRGGRSAAKSAGDSQ